MAPRARSTASRKRKKQKVQQQVSAQASTQALPPAGPPYQAAHGEGLTNVKKKDSSKIGFSDLPPELRNKIYDHALVAPEGEAIPIANFPGISNLRDLGYNLVDTCKAIQEEARPFFYGQNIFRIDLLKIIYGGLSKEMRAQIDEESRAQVPPAFDHRRPYQRYKDHALRHLSPGLAAMSDASLALIDTFVFAIRTPDPRLREDVTCVNIARKPLSVLQLQLFEEEPFVEVIDRRVEIGIMGVPLQVPAWETSGFGRALKNMIEVRDLRKLGKEEILELASALLYESSLHR